MRNTVRYGSALALLALSLLFAASFTAQAQTYCTPGFNNFTIGEIRNVTLSNVNHSTTGWTYPPFYDYTSSVAAINMAPGGAYTMSISWWNQSGSNYTALTYVWFDWNDDGTFTQQSAGVTSGEQVYFGDLATNSGITRTVSKVINIPANAGGAIRMRVAIQNGFVGPCGTTWGATHDYAVVFGDKVLASPTSLSFQAEHTGALPSAQNLLVTPAPATLTWTRTLTQGAPGNWLSATPASAVGPTNIATSILTTNNAPGTYTGNIRLTAGSAPAVDVPVSYQIHRRAVISPSSNPAGLRFGCSGGTLTRTVTMNNLGGHFGGGSLNWTATSTSPDVTILTGSGTEGGQLMFSVDASGLTPGVVYDRWITITATNSASGIAAENSPFSLYVPITVEPSSQQVRTMSVGTGSATQFLNSVGQPFAEVKSNISTIPSLTVTMTPCTIPNGFNRLRYVRRYYEFSGFPANHNVNIKLFYTLTETTPLVLNPGLLSVYHQVATNGTWLNKGGINDMNTFSVTLNNVTNLDGNYGLAHPWIPKPMAVAVTSAIYDRDARSAVLRWSTDLESDDDGFLVERTSAANADGEAWDYVGVVAFTPNKEYTFIDPLADEGVYYYRISAFSRDGDGYESQPIMVKAFSAAPEMFTLEQNYPNPFNPTTTINFSLPEAAKVTLKVYDMFWREAATLVNEERPAGVYQTQFDAQALPSGTYFYRLEAGSFSATRKMNLMK